MFGRKSREGELSTYERERRREAIGTVVAATALIGVVGGAIYMGRKLEADSQERQEQAEAILAQMEQKHDELRSIQPQLEAVYRKAEAVNAELSSLNLIGAKYELTAEQSDGIINLNGQRYVLLKEADAIALQWNSIVDTRNALAQQLCSDFYRCYDPLEYESPSDVIYSDVPTTSQEGS